MKMFIITLLIIFFICTFCSILLCKTLTTPKKTLNKIQEPFSKTQNILDHIEKPLAKTFIMNYMTIGNVKGKVINKNGNSK